MTAPQQPTQASATEHESLDLTVVGAGCAGLSAALFAVNVGLNLTHFRSGTSE